MTNESLADRFPIGKVLTVRTTAGPGSLCLVVREGPDRAHGHVWDLSTGALGPELPFAAGLDALLSPDGQWVVNLDDDGGSEVGRLVAHRLDGSETRVLTPDWGDVVLRGLEMSADGASVLATIVDDAGHHVVLIPIERPESATVLMSSTEETWFAHISADSAYVCADTCDHNPGVRRPAVTVVEVANGAVVAVANDLPAGPLRAVRFSDVPGDPRILLATERSGFNRPAVWNPVTGERRDYDLPELPGEALVLDWHAASGTILLVDAAPGCHRLLGLDEHTGELRVISDDRASFADPDVASVFPYYSQSFLDPSGRAVVVTSTWTTPLHVLRESDAGLRLAIEPPSVPAGRHLESALVEISDDTTVQLWWAAPEGQPRGTILEVHGGPNLATLDQYEPCLQAFLAAGYAVASLNYRGSVTFGRAFREGFWGGGGDPEIRDIEAALDFLGQQGLADPASTFITGPSYGGHLSLLSVGRLPDRFAGALAVVAMADWDSAWDGMNPALRKTWRSFMSLTPEGVFDDARIEPTLARMSSINYVDRVRASVWLYQGGRDTRTPPEQARSYSARLRAAGGDVVTEWFDAGHEPTGTEGALLETTRMLELVEARLAGKPWHTIGPA